jgi:hypothetical protein
MTINRLWTHYKQNPKKTGDRKNTIFLMCDNTCQICFYNENKKMLDIHHIDHDRKNNTFENLACLCVWCHNEHHRLGIHKNIKSILEFIKEKFIGV